MLTQTVTFQCQSLEQILKNVNILICSAGRRVELVESFQEALINLGLSGKVFTTDISPDRSAACRFSYRSFKVPEASSALFVSTLLDICVKHRVGLVVPTIDTELMALAKCQKRFLENGVNVVVSSSEIVSICRDKRKTASFFRSIGVDTPLVYSKNAIIFPCFCKPFDGSSSNGNFYLKDEKAITPEIFLNEKNIFMEFIGSDFSEYTIDTYFDFEGNLIALVPRERLEVRAGEVSKGITRRGFVYDYLKPRLSYKRGFRGCVTFQVFANAKTKKIKAIEANARFGGGYPLTHSSGARFSEWLIKEYLLEQKVHFFEDWTANLLMLRYDAKVLVDEN